jgi:hypothetical protein
VHFLDFVVVKPLLFFPDREASLHLLLGAFVQQIPYLLD